MSCNMFVFQNKAKITNQQLRIFCKFQYIVLVSITWIVETGWDAALTVESVPISVFYVVIR